MYTAFFKHALPAGLLAAFLGVLAPLAAPAATALAETGGEASSAGAQTTTAQTTATPNAAATTTAATPPASGSTSGGAAPTPAASGKLALATWFGPGFYGHTTACGQKLTPKLVGVASRTLPCGTLVQIDYHGHQLTAPVLDRGPYGHNGALWDLTSGAARALEIKETVRIATQVVGSVPNTPTLGEPPLAAAPSAGAPSSPPATPSPSAATGGAAAG
jgi:rare lipoprotein A